MSLEIILASILLVTDAEPPKAIVEALAPALLALMVSAEIVGASDIAYYRDQVRLGEWSRVANLAANMACLPRVADSQFVFIPEELAALQKMNRAYREYLTCRRQFDWAHADVIDDAIVDTYRLYCVYELAATAADVNISMWGRRTAFDELRAVIGDEAFYAGRLPACLPRRHIPVSHPAPTRP